jgi:hypothetical protein
MLIGEALGSRIGCRPGGLGSWRQAGVVVVLARARPEGFVLGRAVLVGRGGRRHTAQHVFSFGGVRASSPSTTYDGGDPGQSGITPSTQVDKQLGVNLC